MATTIIYTPSSYQGEPEQGSPEEMQACDNIIAALRSFKLGMQCPCCQAFFGAHPDQTLPSLTLVCDCRELTVVFDHNTTFSDVLAAIDACLTPLDPQEDEDIEAPRFACYEEPG